MLGKQIRGYQHLLRSVGISQPRKHILRNSNGRVSVVEIFKDDTTNTLYLFNNSGWGRGGSSNIPTTLPRTIQDIFLNLQLKYSSCSTIRSSHDYQAYSVSELIQLPEGFDKQYESVIQSNKKLFSNIFGRYCSEQEAVALYLFTFAYDTPNLFAWALTNFYKNSVSLYLLCHILRWQRGYPQLVKKLTKGTITAYNNRNQVSMLYNEMIALRREKRANDVFNLFNTAQKRLLKSIELNDDILNACSAFTRLSQTKKINFVRKMSTIDSAEEIFRQMKLLSKVQFEWSKASLMAFINNAEENGLDCDIIIDRDNLLVVKVNNFETIKYLAKTTNWCISKNKRYWNDYMYNRHEKATQYIIFDFDKKEDDEYSIVGFTTAPDFGITDAHSFTNVSMMSRSHTHSNMLTSFLPQLSNSIDSLLDIHKIPMELIYECEPSLFKWNKDAVIEFIDYALGEDNYDILSDANNKLCIVAKSDNIRFVLGKQFGRNFGTSGNSKFIIFFDFNKSETDSQRILFGKIQLINHTEEESVETIYDLTCSRGGVKSLESLLDEYELPFDVIARVFNVITVFKSACANYDLDIIASLLNNDEVKKELSKKHSKVASILFDSISTSLFSYKSFDFINLFYERCKIKMGDVLPNYCLDRLIGALMYELHRFVVGDRYHLPNEDKMKRFYANEITNERDAIFYGYYHALNVILEHETKHGIIGDDIRGAMFECGKNSELANYITNKMYNLIQFNTLKDDTFIYCKLVARYHNINILEKLSKRNLHDNVIKVIFDHLSPTSSYKKVFENMLNEKKEAIASIVASLA